MNLKKDHSIYILLTYTGTIPSRIIKFFTKKPFSHVSLGLDFELKTLYSFGRKKLNIPFIAGFVTEDIHAGIYSMFENTICEVYKLNVNSKQYIDLRENIDIYQKNNCYRYNFIGLLGVLFGYPIKRKNAFFCSEFVATVLSDSGISLFDKHPSLVEPSDFLACEHTRLIFDGLLCQFCPNPI